MTYTTNMTFVNSSNTFYDVVHNVNIQTNYLLTTGLILGVALFVYSKTIDRGVTSAFVAASFAATIISVLMWFIELTHWSVVTICVLMLLGSVIKRAFD